MQAFCCTLSILGPGHHLFISAVSRAWRETYRKVANVQMTGVGHRNEERVLRTITPQTTLGSAVFASASRVKLAHEHALSFSADTLKRVAGRTADIATLQVAHGLGLPWSSAFRTGVTESGSVIKVRWLHTDLGECLHAMTCPHAARSGSIDVLRWLKEQGCNFGASTCKAAAARAHVHVLQFLHDEGCEWDKTACSAATRNGHLSTLQWLHEHGCPWDDDRICDDAAECGSIEILMYLRQQGCEYNEQTIITAAESGHLETVRFLHESGCLWDADTICLHAAEGNNIELLRYLKQQGCVFSADVMTAAAYKGLLNTCQFLRAEQCPWDTSTCEGAAFNGDEDTLRWLHEQGCPWVIQEVRLAAAQEGQYWIIEYLQGVEPADAGQLTEMLNAAGASHKFAAATRLRDDHGAEWPAALNYENRPWARMLLQWARDAGCTSPTYTNTNSD
jgi:hypothetical protein